MLRSCATLVRFLTRVGCAGTAFSAKFRRNFVQQKMTWRRSGVYPHKKPTTSTLTAPVIMNHNNNNNSSNDLFNVSSARVMGTLPASNGLRSGERMSLVSEPVAPLAATMGMTRPGGGGGVPQDDNSASSSSSARACNLGRARGSNSNGNGGGILRCHSCDSGGTVSSNDTPLYDGPRGRRLFAPQQPSAGRLFAVIEEQRSLWPAELLQAIQNKMQPFQSWSELCHGPGELDSATQAVVSSFEKHFPPPSVAGLVRRDALATEKALYARHKEFMVLDAIAIAIIELQEQQYYDDNERVLSLLRNAWIRYQMHITRRLAFERYLCTRESRFRSAHQTPAHFADMARAAAVMDEREKMLAGCLPGNARQSARAPRRTQQQQQGAYAPRKSSSGYKNKRKATGGSGGGRKTAHKGGANGPR